MYKFRLPRWVKWVMCNVFGLHKFLKSKLAGRQECEWCAWFVYGLCVDSTGWTKMTGGRSPRQKGKRIELWVAKIFGGKRSGYGNPTEPDVTTDTLGIESKKVADFPVFLEDALQTVKKRCRKDLIPIVVVKKTR